MMLTNGCLGLKRLPRVTVSFVCFNGLSKLKASELIVDSITDFKIMMVAATFEGQPRRTLVQYALEAL